VSSPLLSRRDIDFLLFEWLDVESMTVRPRFAEHGRDTFAAVLDLAEHLAAERFASHNKRNDSEEPFLDGDRVRLNPEVALATAAFADAGFIGASMDASVGGLQLPAVVSAACMAWFHAANISTAAYLMLTIAAANLLVAYGDGEQVDRYARPMTEGRFFGTMCLSEAQAGSSLADVATRAQPQPDGTFRLFGGKMWISGGDHELGENIVHLVLARIAGAPPGSKGLSLFAVPKWLLADDGSRAERNDVVLAGLNHKMGYRGTVNTVLNFGDGRHRPGGLPGAVGYLVGAPERGLACMFHMMNEARIAVGLGAAALGYTSYLKSVDYARVRTQGRPAGSADPARPPVPIICHADVRRMLLAQKSYVEGALALNLYCARLLDDEKTLDRDAGRAAARLLLQMLTPIAKSWPAQWCLAANDLAIQVHGGYGYTRDYDVEQHYRDNRLNAIHEGTHGIQALELLGRKALGDGGAGLRAVVTAARASGRRGRAAGPAELAAAADALDAAFDRIVAVTATLAAVDDRDIALANAALYLEAFGHAVIAWMWLEQWAATGDRQGAFYDGKRQAARYFFRWELPKINPLLDVLDAVDRTSFDMDPAWY
jgi:butyryl-CoA dehydrogenase